MKQVGFVGVDSTDIVLYLARLISYVGKKVAIVDYTKQHRMISAASVPDVLFGGSYYKEILVVSADTSIDEEEISSCEYIFSYFGAAVSHPQIAKCMEVFFVTDMVKINSEMLKGVQCSDGTKKYCIVRNWIDLKYKPQWVVDMMEQGFTKNDISVIPYNESDYRAKCYLSIDTKHKINLKELSSNMRDILIAFLTQWETVDDKTLKKIIKSA